MSLSLIVAFDKNYGIGYKNQLPWKLPMDLKHFKETTYGKSVVMGRKTMDSLPNMLPNREHIILTREEKNINLEIKYFNSVNEILSYTKNKEAFIIGGSQIYNLFIEHVEKLYVTYIDHEFKCDTFFPELKDNWKLVSEIKGIKNEKNNYDYFFRVYEK